MLISPRAHRVVRVRDLPSIATVCGPCQQRPVSGRDWTRGVTYLDACEGARQLTRSVLTTLGIIIGGAVIIVAAIGSGRATWWSGSISGSNLLIVEPGTVTSGGVRLFDGVRLTETTWPASARGVSGVNCRSARQSRVDAGARGQQLAIHPVMASVPGSRSPGLGPVDDQGSRDVAWSANGGALFGVDRPSGSPFASRMRWSPSWGYLTRKSDDIGQGPDGIIVVPLRTAKAWCWAAEVFAGKWSTRW